MRLFSLLIIIDAVLIKISKILIFCFTTYFYHLVFSHHVVHYEGQGGPVQASSKPRPEVLALIGRASESLRPDIQHLLSHLNPDVNSSVYAAFHPKLAQNPTQVQEYNILRRNLHIALFVVQKWYRATFLIVDSSGYISCIITWLETCSG